MFNRMKAKNERGMVMVEAVIYFPLVIAIVSLVLYIVLFNVQEYLIMYQCQKLAADSPDHNFSATYGGK